LDKNVVYDVITAALSTGGDFAEVFAEHKFGSRITMTNGLVETALSGLDYGVGIRVFDGNTAIYAYTNDTTKDNLLTVAKQVAQAVKERTKKAQEQFTEVFVKNVHPIIKLPNTIDSKTKVEVLRLANAAAFSYDKLITQTSLFYLDSIQDVLIANSEGLWANDRRVYTRAGGSIVASNGDEKQTSFFGPGAMKGFEHFDTINIEEMAKANAKTAITMLKADYCKAGRMPVVVENGFGAVIFHEACGHSLEATSVARGASVFCGKMGQQIANPVVNAVDDGTIPNMWGSINIDDEGSPTQRNMLIENGILKSYLVDRLNGIKMGTPSTGSARRESYKFAPTSRMTNTIILCGKDSQQDIIGSVENGLYAAKMGGGSVEPSTGEFNFAVTEAYMIRNGKIVEPVRGATLIGSGAEVLMNIDMISDNLDYGQGVCGSMSGGVPTNNGQPMIRVKEMTVGGR
jgi:TldD protein